MGDGTMSPDLAEYQGAHDAIIKSLLGDGVIPDNEQFAADRIKEAVAMVTSFVDDPRKIAASGDFRETMSEQLDQLRSSAPPEVVALAEKILHLPDFTPGSKPANLVMKEMGIDGSPEKNPHLKILEDLTLMPRERLDIYASLAPQN
ncbi:hypothetical protein HY411_01830 [Candidatus Gottesmanbacteria bacterium]|nr:hypothetical protein [Candidatus Gottesmanbacteria bacterium]